jgi:uncharacterized repeat protein (TIGR01451 family)
MSIVKGSRTAPGWIRRTTMGVAGTAIVALGLGTFATSTSAATISSTTRATHASAVMVAGQQNEDNATVTGNATGGSPTGSVTFYICGSGATSCDLTTGTLLGTVPLSAGADNTATAQSASYTPLVSGDFCFAAYYSGSSTYYTSNDTADGQCFKVNRAPSTTVTTPEFSNIGLGQSNYDNGLITGDTTIGAPTGPFLTFICGPKATSCSSKGTQVGGKVDINPVAGTDTATAQSMPYTPDAVGNWCFAGYYSTNASYAESWDTTADECFTVGPAGSGSTPLSGFSTTPSSATAGAPATDSATVTGNATSGSPTGSITFYECGPGATTCSAGSGTLVGSSPLSGAAGNTATATSPSWIPATAGGYCYAATYDPPAGGAYSAQADTSSECFTVAAGGGTTPLSGFDTTPSSAAAAAPADDSAIVTGNATDGSPTGSITFYECGPGATTCTSATGTLVGTGPLSGAAGDTATTTSPSWIPATAGAYCYAATYNPPAGSPYAAESDPTPECFTVGSGSVTPPVALTDFTTTPSGALAGSSASDSATVTGTATAGSPTGTITFYECGPSVTTCSTGGTPIGSGTLSAGGGDTATATSPAWVPTTPGAYCYAAAYTPPAGGAYAAETAPTPECFTIGAVALSKSSNPSGSVGPGQVITYTLTATNTGTTGSVVVPVNDTVPAGTTYVAGSASCGTAVGCTATEKSGKVTFDLAPLAPGASDTVTFQVVVNSGLKVTSIDNVANFTGANCASGVNCSSNKVVNPVAEFKVTKSESAGKKVYTGMTKITYTLAATNLSPAAGSINLSDPVPTGTTYVAGSAACPTLTAPASCTASFDGATKTVEWSLNNVGKGTYDVTFQAGVNPGDASGATISNTGFWSGPGCTPKAPLTSCPTNKVTTKVSAILLTGRAYGLSATASLLGSPVLDIVPVPDTGAVATSLPGTVAPACVANIMGLVNAGVVCSDVVTTDFPDASTAASSVANVGIGLNPIPAIDLDAVSSTSTTTCAGSTGSTTIAYLAVGTDVIIGAPTQVSPNTVINVAGITITLNEQIAITGPDHGLTVNAVDVEINEPGIVTASVIVASSSSDIEGCP